MISVIMSAKNAEDTIAQTIESILHQTFTQFEFIMVDNNSTDGTLAIMERYARRDPRIRVMRYTEGGWTGAVNMAMRDARYEWIARIDADDIALPHRFARQIAAIEREPDVILWGSYAYQINWDGERIGYVEHGPVTREQFSAVREAGQPVFILNPTTIFRKDIALALGGFNEQLVAAGDEEMWSRMYEHGVMLVIPEHLIKYRIHTRSISATKARYQMRVHRFIIARGVARRAGQELTYDEYQQAQNNRPWLARATEFIGETGRILYRRSGSYLGQKQYVSAGFALAVALILNPRFTVARAGHRIARRWQKQPLPSLITPSEPTPKEPDQQQI